MSSASFFGGVDWFMGWFWLIIKIGGWSLLAASGVLLIATLVYKIPKRRKVK